MDIAEDARRLLRILETEAAVCTIGACTCIVYLASHIRQYKL
jgi:hypothetical protein